MTRAAPRHSAVCVLVPAASWAKGTNRRVWQGSGSSRARRRLGIPLGQSIVIAPSRSETPEKTFDSDSLCLLSRSFASERDSRTASAHWHEFLQDVVKPVGAAGHT